MQHQIRAAKFLIVDDDQISVMAMQRAMRKLKIVNETHVCSDGQQALEFLAEETKNEGSLPPYVVTLDLNMPRMGGLEFLDEVRADPALSKIVVFVFTTSDIPKDVQQAYAHNVAGYVIKENPSKTFAEALDMLDTYARIVELPH
ncbi:MAG: response regulator [Pseudomonadota bacterium]